MQRINHCPRCTGTLLWARDPRDEDPLVSCLQCGFSSYRPLFAVASVPPVPAPLVAVSEYDALEVA